MNQAVDRRRSVKNSQEQWYAVGGIKPSSEDSASRAGVKISNTVEEGRVEYVPVRVNSLSTPGPTNLRVSSGKSKKRKISRSPVKRRFEIASPPSLSQRQGVVEDLSFVPFWTLSKPAQNPSVVGETGEPLLFSRVDCHFCCCLVSNFETTLCLLIAANSSSFAIRNCFCFF